MKPAFIALLALCLCLGGCGKKAAQIPQEKAKATQKAKPKVEAKKPEQPKAVLTKLITNPIVERALRKQIKKPTGELTKADLEKVRELYLGDSQLTKVPRGLERLTQLKSLYLTANQLTNVKGLEKLTQLEELLIDANQLTNVTGLEKLTKLKMLSLMHNQLTDVKGLEKLTELTTLYLMDNPDLTKAQIDQLQKALPKCKIGSNPTK